MKFFTFLTILLLAFNLSLADSAKQIFERKRPGICLVSYFHNMSSDTKIGSYNKIKKNRIGILVNESGLVMVNSDIYPVSMDIASDGNGSLFSGIPSDFKVTLSDQREFDAEFLGKDDQAQVAFIQIQNLPPELALKPVTFAGSAHIGVGDPVYLLELLTASYNFEPVFFPTHIHAVLSAPWRRFLIKEARGSLSYGGLLLDQSGKAVGVTVYKDFDFSPPGEFNNGGIFLEIFPSEVFAGLIANPPKADSARQRQKSWLGIRMQALSAELAAYWNIPQKGGIIINKILPESPAKKAGLQNGDVLLSINGVQLTSQKDEEMSEVRTMIRQISPGEMAKIEFWRAEKIHQKSVRLVAAPKTISLAEKHIFKKLGLEIRELTKDVLFEENLPADFAGVFVFQTDHASAAGLGGLRVGDIITHVNNKAVKNLETAVQIFTVVLAGEEQRMMLQVSSRKETRFVFIDLKNR